MAFNPFHGFRKHAKIYFAALTIVCMLTFVLCSGSNREPLLDRLRGLFHKSDAPKITLAGQTVETPAIHELAAQRTLARALFSAAILGSDELRKSSSGEQVAVNRVSERLFTPESFFAQYFAMQQRLQRGIVIPIPQEPLESLLDFFVLRQLADQMGIQLTQADIEARFNQLVGEGGAWKTALAALPAEYARSRHIPTKEEASKAVSDELRVALVLEALMGGSPPSSQVKAMTDEQLAQMTQQMQQIQLGQLDEYPLPRPGPFSPYDFWKYYQENAARLRVALIPVPVNPENVAKTPSEEDLKTLFNQYKDIEPKPNSPGYGFKVPQQMRVKWVSVKPDGAQFREQAQRVLPLLPAGDLLSVGVGAVGADTGPAAITTVALTLLAADGPKEAPWDFPDPADAAKKVAGKVTLYSPTTLAGYGALLSDQETNTPTKVLAASHVGLFGGVAVASGTAPPFLSFATAIGLDSPLKTKELMEDRKLEAGVAALGGSPWAAVPAVALANDPFITGKTAFALQPPTPMPYKDASELVKERLILGLAREIAVERMETLHKAFAKVSTEKDVAKVLAAAQAGPGDAVAALAAAQAGGPVGPLTVLPAAVIGTTHVVSTEFDLEARYLDAKTPFAIRFDHQGETSRLASRTDIVNDPGMVHFRDISRDSFFTIDRTTPTTEKKDTAFGDILFNMQANFQPQQGPAILFPDQQGGGMRVLPLWFSGADRLPDELVLYWRTDNREARAPEFKEAREQVEKAWRLRQARDEAKRTALKLSDKPSLKKILATSQDPDDILKVLKELAAEEKLGTQVIELKEDDRVSRVVPGPVAVATGGKAYPEFKMPASVPNTGPAFVEELVRRTLRKPGKPAELDTSLLLKDLEQLPPENRIVVLPDDRAQTFYVAVVLKRELGTTEQVLEAYRKGYQPVRKSFSGVTIPPADPMLNRFVSREQTNYQLEVMKQLRAKAGPVDAKGQFDIPKEFRDQFKSGDASE